MRAIAAIFSFERRSSELRSSELRPTAISRKTVFACLSRMCAAQAGNRAGSADACAEPMLPVEEVISFGRNLGLKMQLRTLTWFRLMVILAHEPVLLCLNNGNTIIAYRKGGVGQDHLVASDPLYEDGNCFILPRDALEQVWKGDALLIERGQTAIMRVTTLLLWVLSITGFIAAAFVIFRVLYELTW
jgi:hypothetical protein